MLLRLFRIELLFKEHYQKEDEHFELPLPVKESTLPDNRTVAMKRLSGLRNKTKGNKAMCEDYVTFMRKTFDSGYAEEVTQEGEKEGRIWYLPHHAVYQKRRR